MAAIDIARRLLETDPDDIDDPQSFMSRMPWSFDVLVDWFKRQTGHHGPVSWRNYSQFHYHGVTYTSYRADGGTLSMLTSNADMPDGQVYVQVDRFRHNVREAQQVFNISTDVRLALNMVQKAHSVIANSGGDFDQATTRLMALQKAFKEHQNRVQESSDPDQISDFSSYLLGACKPHYALTSKQIRSFFKTLGFKVLRTHQYKRDGQWSILVSSKDERTLDWQDELLLKDELHRYLSKLWGAVSSNNPHCLKVDDYDVDVWHWDYRQPLHAKNPHNTLQVDIIPLDKERLSKEDRWPTPYRGIRESSDPDDIDPCGYVERLPDRAEAVLSRMGYTLDRVHVKPSISAVPARSYHKKVKLPDWTLVVVVNEGTPSIEYTDETETQIKSIGRTYLVEVHWELDGLTREGHTELAFAYCYEADLVEVLASLEPVLKRAAEIGATRDQVKRHLVQRMDWTPLAESQVLQPQLSKLAIMLAESTDPDDPEDFIDRQPGVWAIRTTTRDTLWWYGDYWVRESWGAKRFPSYEAAQQEHKTKLKGDRFMEIVQIRLPRTHESVDPDDPESWLRSKFQRQNQSFSQFDTKLKELGWTLVEERQVGVENTEPREFHYRRKTADEKGMLDAYAYPDLSGIHVRCWGDKMLTGYDERDRERQTDTEWEVQIEDMPEGGDGAAYAELLNEKALTCSEEPDDEDFYDHWREPEPPPPEWEREDRI